MAINIINLPYPDFKIGDVIEPEEFDANNQAIVSVVNQLVNAVNVIPGSDGDDIFLPTYIKETHIEGAEIRSPLITGNTLIGSTGMVGITSVGTTSDSIRIWAGNSNKLTAPFRVTHSGNVTMTDANITGIFNTTNSFGKLTSQLVNDAANGGGTLFINDNRGFPSIAVSDAGTLAGSQTVGGIIQVYLHSMGERRVTIGILKDAEAGIITMQNKLNKRTVELRAGNGINSHGEFTLLDSNSVDKVKLNAIGTSYITDKFAVGGQTVIASCAAQVNGSLNIVGDIYVNGVKMKLTPA